LFDPCEQLVGEHRAGVVEAQLATPKARLPPTIDGEAGSSSPWRSLNCWGLERDTQSIAFLRTPGGEETTKP
jgi:hypothetical protein